MLTKILNSLLLLSFIMSSYQNKVSTERCAVPDCERCFPGDPQRCLHKSSLSFLLAYFTIFFGGMGTLYLAVLSLIGMTQKAKKTGKKSK